MKFGLNQVVKCVGMIIYIRVWLGLAVLWDHLRGGHAVHDCNILVRVS
jgi:hypothetical protein